MPSKSSPGNHVRFHSSRTQLHPEHAGSKSRTHRNQWAPPASGNMQRPIRNQCGPHRTTQQHAAHATSRLTGTRKAHRNALSPEHAHSNTRAHRPRNTQPHGNTTAPITGLTSSRPHDRNAAPRGTRLHRPQPHGRATTYAAPRKSRISLRRPTEIRVPRSRGFYRTRLTETRSSHGNTRYQEHVCPTGTRASPVIAPTGNTATETRVLLKSMVSPKHTGQITSRACLRSRAEQPHHAARHAQSRSRTHREINAH